MYFNMFGGSALLHLLAGYPRVVAAFGIAATLSMLSSPLGPGRHGGTASYLDALNNAVVSQHGEGLALAKARFSAEQLERADSQARYEAVRYSLDLCGAYCAELTPAIVLNDTQLTRDALLLFELDKQSREPESIRRVAIRR